MPDETKRLGRTTWMLESVVEKVVNSYPPEILVVGCRQDFCNSLCNTFFGMLVDDSRFAFFVKTVNAVTIDGKTKVTFRGESNLEQFRKGNVLDPECCFYDHYFDKW